MVIIASAGGSGIGSPPTGSYEGQHSKIRLQFSVNKVPCAWWSVTNLIGEDIGPMFAVLLEFVSPANGALSFSM